MVFCIWRNSMHMELNESERTTKNGNGAVAHLLILLCLCLAIHWLATTQTSIAKKNLLRFLRHPFDTLLAYIYSVSHMAREWLNMTRAGFRKIREIAEKCIWQPSRGVHEPASSICLGMAMIIQCLSRHTIEITNKQDQHSISASAAFRLVHKHPELCMFTYKMKLSWKVWA